MKTYNLLKDNRTVGHIGVWANHTGQYTEIIGYTILGSIILLSPETQEYLLLHPRMAGNNAKFYGEFDSIDEFENTILKDSDFHQACIDPLTNDDIQNMINRLGQLENEECYYPCPDPAIGGSGKPETFNKGNVWISADISGQNRGLD